MVSNKFQRKFRCVKISEDKREKMRVLPLKYGKRNSEKERETERDEDREREREIQIQRERANVCEREKKRICGKILVSVDFSV